MKNNTTYSQRIWQRFNRIPSARWGFRLLGFVFFIALFANIIANDKPLYCEVEGRHYFPAFRQYLFDLGIANWPKGIAVNDMEYGKFENSIYPLIPYSSTQTDLYNKGKGPFSKQKVESQRLRHWLGAGNKGHDVAASLVWGARVAILVGFLSMIIAGIIGIFFGSLAGYFGDSGYKTSRGGLLFNLLAIAVAIFYTFIARKYQWQLAIQDGNFFLESLKGILIFAVVFFVTRLLKFPFRNISFFKKQVNVPLDSIIMRLVEVIRSIPGLLLLMAILSILTKSSILNIILIIGLIGWTSIATFLRAEMLKIRELEYIQSAKVFGFSHWRIILNHALPNAITPLLITFAFGIAGAILLEAFLSFLGIGVAFDQMTWGKMLAEIRDTSKSWWMAVFPGLAIFITITNLNLIGDGLEKAMSESNL